MHVVVAGDYPRSPEHISGGVESVVLYLTQALQCYPDLELDIVTLDRWRTGQGTVRYENVTVHYLPPSGLPSRLSAWENIRLVRDIMLDLNPDLIHVQVAGGMADAAADTGVPWVLTLHGIRHLEITLWQGLLNRYRGWFIKREEFRAIKRARHLISISPFVRSAFNGYLQDKEVYDIENPVADTFFEQPFQKGEPGRMLFAGRLIPRKGIHTLLRAFAELHRRVPTATLRLAGGSSFKSEPGNYHRELKQFVADAGLEKAVHFLGELDESDLLEEYASCSALVLSSVLETAPMVIMQAMAAGKAVVSTDAGGSRYLVEHGQTGLIVPINDVQALAEALYQVLSDEATLQAMGHRARALAQQRFHNTVVAARTRDVYYGVLGQVPPHQL
jgi:glycosyltransferase involved in cell wall biosynthesis